jgi:hypothetical protein
LKTSGPIFTVGATSYDWQDVVLAGCLWGEWPVLEERVRMGLACLARLDDLDEDDDGGLDEEDIEDAAAEFRYARDLVAAADLEAWLDARGLDVDGWLDHIKRGLLLQRWAKDLDEIKATHPVDVEAIEAVIGAEAICSGVAGDLATRLAARAAVYVRAIEQGSGAVGEDEVGHLVSSVRDTARVHGLTGASAGAGHERLEHLARLEAVWRRFVSTEAPPRAIQAAIAARYLDWFRVSVQSVRVRDIDAAREVALCVRDDGRELDDIAAEAGLALEWADWWIEDVEASLRDRLVAARSGDLLGPLAVDGGFLLVSVLAKRSPSPDDPEVQARAERAALAAAVDREVSRRVTWHAVPL